MDSLLPVSILAGEHFVEISNDNHRNIFLFVNHGSLFIFKDSKGVGASPLFGCGMEETRVPIT